MRCAAALLVTLALVTPSRAATFNVGGFAGSTPIIDIRGPLLDGDDRKFDLFADALPQAVVRLDSPGGQLWAGLSIGEAIARKGYATFVASGRVCASACGFAWLAGHPRVKSQLAMVGFHGAYAQIDGRTEQTGSGNAMVGAYMTNLHFGYPAVVFATSARPDDMLWLTSETAKESGISYESRSEIETTFWSGGPAPNDAKACCPAEPLAAGASAQTPVSKPDQMQKLLEGADEDARPTIGGAPGVSLNGVVSPVLTPTPSRPMKTRSRPRTGTDRSSFDPADISKILNTAPH